MTGIRNGADGLFQHDVDSLSVGDRNGAFRGALRPTQMAPAIDPATAQALDGARQIGDLEADSALASAGSEIITNVSGSWLTAAGSGAGVQAARVASDAAEIEVDTTVLGKLHYGLSDIYIESQRSVAGLSGSERDHGLSGFVSENAGAHIINGMISIDAVASNGDGAALLVQLQALGLQLGASFGSMAGGLIPIDALDDLASLDLLGYARPVYTQSHVGTVTGQQYVSMNVDNAVAAYQTAGVNSTLNGAGITVGVISDSFDTRTVAATHYAQDVTNGDLPAGVNVLLDAPTAESDEGRAMAQAVYDIAPGVSLAFYTAWVSEASFAAGIVKLSQPISSGGGGAKIIVDDVSYFDEPFFQDGIVAQAVNQATANGAMYFSSAGNSGTSSWEGGWIDSGSTANIGGTIYRLLDFNPATTGANATDTKLNLAANSGGTFVLNWDQPSLSAGGLGSGSDMALIFYKSDGTSLGAVNEVNFGFDAVEIAQFGAIGARSVAIGLRNGDPTPGLIKLTIDGATTSEYKTNSGTATGHTNAETALSVGASDWVDSSRFGNFPLTGVPFPYAETYSSKGGVPILFDTAGNRLATPQLRSTVDFTASDGGNNSFFGDDAPYDTDTFGNFYGTSQAAPNAAAVAALLMQKFPTATRAQIEQAMKESAVDIVANYAGATTTAGIGVGPDLTTGTGLIQADKAVLRLAAITNHAPVISVEDLVGAVTELTTAPVGNITDSGKINFTDADGVWAHAVSANGTPVGSVLGSLTASVTHETAADGSGGEVTWSYSVSAAATEYLAAGQTKTDTFTIVIDDQHGATVTKTIAVTITGTGDAPVISVVPTDTALANLAETNGALATSGTLTVVDTDTTDTVSPSVLSVTASGTTAGLVPANSVLKAMLALSPSSLTADVGSVHNLTWNFNSGSEAFNYLDEGETLTLTYVVRATDTGALTGDQTVTVNITGTNDAPTIGLVAASDRDSVSLTDGNSALLAQGTLTVTDPDQSDGTSNSVFSLLSTPAFVSGFPLMTVVPASSAANPGGGAGNLNWQFLAGPNTFDFLAAGETQQLTYGLKVTDDSGASAVTNVAVTITGVNEAPVVIGSLPSATAVVELVDGSAGENASSLTGTGTISYADTDLSDTHSASVAANGSGYLGSFTLGAVNQGANSVGWTFSVSDSALNALAQGVVLHQDYTVTVSDGHGGTASTVVGVDLIGSNDAAILSSANVVVTQGLSPATAGGTLTISDDDNPALFQALNGTPGTYGSLSLTAAGNWSYVANNALLSLAPGQVATDTFTVRAVDGTPTTITVSIAGSNDVAIARMDSFTTTEAATLGAGKSLFGDNGSGADNDPDGPPLAISAVNGDSAFVGQQLHLLSGALLTVNANGTFSYNPNHAFDSLTQASGATNQSAFDSFTYTLAGGTTATVFVNVTGVDGAGDLLRGNSGDNVVTGFGTADNFRFEQGGTDTGYGMGGNDGFYFGGAFDSTDTADGGEGSDTLALQGNTDADLGNVTNVEVILALSGSDSRFGDNANNRYDYDLTSNDGNVGAGQTLTVSATGLLVGEDLHFDGSAETDGNFRIFAGQGNDDLTGGAGGDGFFFGADGNLTGADHVDGGAGTDTVALRGDYSGANAVVFTNASLASVEVVAMLSGHSNPLGGPIAANGFDYDVTMADGNVAAGRSLDVIATGLGSDESVRFDGRAETDGAFRILSGAGDDTLWGGAGNDMIYGGRGADRLIGGAGADTYVFLSAADSTSTGYDTIVGFDWHVDRIDAPGGATRSLGATGGGTLSTASFDADLAAGLNGVLGAGQAVLFAATDGTLAGHVFAVIDGNGIAGYQAGADLVIDLVNPVAPIDPTMGLIV